MSGVRISFGLDRIYLVVEELIFQKQLRPQLRHCIMEVRAFFYAMKINKGCQYKVELYQTMSKVRKQFQHADKRTIPFAVIAGEQEMATNSFSLKNLATGDQM
jgi:histidyl-tRNA synthetase